MDARYRAGEHFRQGLALLEAGQAAAALARFREAHQLDPAAPRFQSYYGLALALVERRFSSAVEFCRAAVKEEFYCPDLYHNLARVYLSFGFRGEALRYLRRGLMVDPDHAGLLDSLAELGLRRSPVLSFLPRRHFLNRWLGRLRRLAGMREESPLPGAAQPSA